MSRPNDSHSVFLSSHFSYDKLVGWERLSREVASREANECHSGVDDVAALREFAE